MQDSPGEVAQPENRDSGESAKGSQETPTSQGQVAHLASGAWKVLPKANTLSESSLRRGLTDRAWRPEAWHKCAEVVAPQVRAWLGIAAGASDVHLGKQGLLLEGCRPALLARQQKHGLECGWTVECLAGGRTHAWKFWPRLGCHHHRVFAARGPCRPRALLQVGQQGASEQEEMADICGHVCRSMVQHHCAAVQAVASRPSPRRV